MSNSISNVIAVASNAKRITVIVENKDFNEVVSIRELQMITTITEQLEVICNFEHHSVTFIMDTNTIVTIVTAN